MTSYKHKQWLDQAMRTTGGCVRRRLRQCLGCSVLTGRSCYLCASGSQDCTQATRTTGGCVQRRLRQCLGCPVLTGSSCYLCASGSQSLECAQATRTTGGCVQRRLRQCLGCPVLTGSSCYLCASGSQSLDCTQATRTTGACLRRRMRQHCARTALRGAPGTTTPTYSRGAPRTTSSTRCRRSGQVRLHRLALLHESRCSALGAIWACRRTIFCGVSAAHRSRSRMLIINPDPRNPEHWSMQACRCWRAT